MITYFNPENDMALADGRPHYRPPAEVERMKQDLCLLPVWYAGTGDSVKVDVLPAGRWDASVPLWPDVPVVTRWTGSRIAPWGWNPALITELRREGVPPACYPTDGQMERIRTLSGRQQCVALQQALQTVGGVGGVSVVCHTMDEVSQAVRRFGDTLLKSPWSGSGRGLVRVSAATWTANVAGWAGRVLRTQGALMAEPIYNKVIDFAMEFCAVPAGGVRFVGYSLFETDTHGNYKLNLLRTDEAIEAALTAYVDRGVLLAVREVLCRELSRWVAGCYTGWLGVDMMICREGAGYWLHPCVEVNLRMNMGIVAHRLYGQWVEQGAEGIFAVVHHAAGEALAFHRRMQERQAAVVHGGRLSHGYLSLTPVGADTRYQAYLCIG